MKATLRVVLNYFLQFFALECGFFPIRSHVCGSERKNAAQLKEKYTFEH
jgi:hypothetical protein